MKSLDATDQKLIALLQDNARLSTVALAKAVAAATQAGKLRSVAGGGDTVSALRHAGVLDQFSYVSSAGGAFLEWMEGKTLPGVAALG
jgi:phosphoglycerate kinase